MNPSAPSGTAMPGQSSHHDLCAVCGDRAGTASIDDTNGWRWFNDGKGGLLPLCATCPPPPEVLDQAVEPARLTV
jgi:hypothetical protein